MERSTALKKIKAILGEKNFSYRVNDKAPTADEREAAKARLPDAIAERDRLSKLMTARKQVLLQDPEFQALCEAEKSARELTSNLSGAQYSYRFAVGKIVMGLFFEVRAEGDSWEEVIDKLTKKKAVA